MGETSSMIVAGVDGCRDGWVVASHEIEPQLSVANFRPISVAEMPIFADVREYCDILKVDAVAVDMPIGLAVDGTRIADWDARNLLGPRRSTFFPTPSHAVLSAVDWNGAQRLNKEYAGKGLSKQAYNLLDKMRDVRGALAPDDQPRFSEAHPELSFAALAGEPLVAKTCLAGQLRRIELIRRHLGPLPTAVSAGTESTAKLDDVLDACILVWTAARMVAGEAVVLGDTDGVDPDGYQLTVTF